MSDLVTAQEAAALWGCTDRNILRYVKEGRLVPVTYVERVVAPAHGGRLTIRTPMFRPADILKLRQVRNRQRVTTGRARAMINNRNQIHRQALVRAWWSLPKAERKGRNWMTTAYNHIHGVSQ